MTDIYILPQAGWTYAHPTDATVEGHGSETEMSVGTAGGASCAERERRHYAAPTIASVVASETEMTEPAMTGHLFLDLGNRECVCDGI